jgi:hypothetical protein
MRRCVVLALALVGCLGLALGGSLASPTGAFAAGSGYAPSGNPTDRGTASGLAGAVVSSTTVQPSGGTATGTVGSSTITVTVPAGAFKDPVQVVLTDATTASVTPSTGGSVIVAFGIGIYVNGTKITGTFPAITVAVTSSAITVSSMVDFVGGSGLQAVSGATIGAGSATFTITSDPVVELASAPAGGTTIVGATSGHTGKPFLLEGVAAIALVVFGTVMLVGLRFRRRSA